MTTGTMMGSVAKVFELFRVIERGDGERAEWRKVGTGVLAVAGGLRISIDGVSDSRVLHARPIDRRMRPVPAEKDPRHYPTHELFEPTEENRRVGAVFKNRDHSFTLIIDEGQRDGMKPRLQLREARARRRSPLSVGSAQ